MKSYYIFDNNNNKTYAIVYAKNEKSALKKYSKGLTSTGFYYILKDNNNNQWFLSSSYGMHISAIACYYPELQENLYTVIK